MSILNLDYVLMLSQRDVDIREHILLLYCLPFIINAKVICEIGAGQSTFALTASANVLKAQFYSIDLTKEARLRGFPEGEGILEKEYRYHFIQGHSLEVCKTWDKEIDFLFIDSGHIYDLTLNELNQWIPWVRKEGIIALHDTSRNNIELADCRRALDDFMTGKERDFITVQYDNQNGFTILKKL